jgi:NYN domain
VRANVYVDGFSLYYAALKGTPYKWLNLWRLSRFLLPRDRIHRIRYFTTLPSLFPWDQSRGQPHLTYVRALKTLPGMSVHYGSFRVGGERLPDSGRPDSEREHVIVREEKGSDVNLASMLLLDGFRGDYEVAVVISTDSDLALPMRLVRTRLQLPVGLLKPGKRRSFANELVRAATFYKPIRKGVLAASQLPVQLRDAHGTITKPSAW